MDCVVTCMLKMWIIPLLAFDYHSVTVSSVRYTKHCVDGHPSEHSLSLIVAHTRVVLFRRSTVETTKIDSCYCYDFGHYSVRVPYVLVDVVLISRVSLTTKITVTLFTIR